MSHRFLEIHTLTSYPASLLNRDDVGFAKRIPFGGSERTRISSQCLKRHWRTVDDENSLDRIPIGAESVPMSIRSRRTFEKYLYEPLINEGASPETAQAVAEKMLAALLPKGKARKAKGEEDETAGQGKSPLHTEQVTIIGRPEMEYLLSLARDIISASPDPKSVGKTFDQRYKGDLKKNLDALVRGAGLDAALFGRMTTGDILARCDAAVHVAHAFSVHDGQFETDYFSAIDDLQGPEETGSGHINTSELSTGLFYGYVVVDVPLLVSNLEGCKRSDWTAVDRSLAAEVIRRLIHLIATVSPGAKLGSTAPYANAVMVLLESSNRQPRTLANAFLDPVPVGARLVPRSFDALGRHLTAQDQMYGNQSMRKLAALEPTSSILEKVDGQNNATLTELARWAAGSVLGEI